MVRHRFGDGAPFFERSNFAAGLERIFRRDQPPDLMQLEVLERQFGKIAMTVMGGIERPTQQADALLHRLPPSLRTMSKRPDLLLKAGTGRRRARCT